MAETVPARLSPREARRFGLVVGTAFLLLGTLVWWRGRVGASQVFWGVGAALIVLGLVLPRALVPVHRGWMGGALAISKVTTPIVLGIVYFTVIAPIGLVRRLGGRSMTRWSRGESSAWVPRKTEPAQHSMERQF